MKICKYHSHVNGNLIFKHSLEIIKYPELSEKLKKFIITKQLLKSRTSIGANVREVQNDESKTGFIHKLKIATIEAHGTGYWLTFHELLKNDPKNELLKEKRHFTNNILSKIISTSKFNN